jgi:hypothetical protein
MMSTIKSKKAGWSCSRSPISGETQALGSEFPDHSRLWEEEIEKRCRAIDEGRARLIPAEEVFERAEAALE